MKTIQKLFPILFLVATQLCAIVGLVYLYLNTFNLI
jgi:hypothetical protein